MSGVSHLIWHNIAARDSFSPGPTCNGDSGNSRRMEGVGWLIMIELEGTGKLITKAMAEQDPELSALFNRMHPAIVFITKPMQIPVPVQTEATLAALRVIDKFQAERREQALQRRARNK